VLPVLERDVQPSLLALSSSPLLQGVTVVVALAAAVLLAVVVLTQCGGVGVV
jgi:hypothetical protein